MRYSIQPKYRKYVPGYGFSSFATKFGSKHGKKLVNTGISSAVKFSNSKHGKKITDTTKKKGLTLVK